MYSGPERPESLLDYTNVSTSSALTGHALKIVRDLERSARLCNGKQASIYLLTDKERCPACTNALTGARLITNCATCGGTGFIKGYEFVGTFWTYITVSPIVTTDTDLGNIDNPGMKDSATVIGAPVLGHAALFYYPQMDTMYKLARYESQFVALQGSVITQVAQISRLAKGAPEYKVVTK